MSWELPAVAQTFSALLTPAIAVVVTWIAYQQFKTARAKLNLDLFDKRLAVYNQVRDAVRIINGSGRVNEEADRHLLEAINASEFLFGEDIRVYLETMWHRFSRLRVAQSQMQSSHEETRLAAVAAQSAVLNEITQFYYEGADVFAHYMRMDHRLRAPLKRRRRGPHLDAKP